MINNKIEKNNCLFSSENSQWNNEYIQYSKFLPNDSFLIINDKSINKFNYDYNNQKNSIEKLGFKNKFAEKDYIYDYDVISNNNLEKPYICLCSKDNPIRILNNDLSLIKSFALENKSKEEYLSPIFIKYEEFGINIFTGKNFLSKIDLIKQKEIFIKFNKNYNYLSCFDYNHKYSCYFMGSYSHNLLMCDYKTDKIIEIYKQEKSINEIKILNTQEYKMLVGYRNTDYICLFDIRKMNQYINKLERNSLTTKKINFVLDKDENTIYCGDISGNITKYSFLNEMNDNEINQNNFIKDEIYIEINNYLTSIDLENKNNLLIVTYENKNNTINNSLNYESDNDDNSKQSGDKNTRGFKIFKI